MTTKLYKTKNDLPEAARTKLVELLNSRLVSAIDLQTQAKQAHWNVKGPQFIALHELFDKVSESAENAVDEIAERAVQLGGVARGTARIVAKESALKEYALDAVTGAEHVEALASALAAFGSQVRSAIALAFTSEESEATYKATKNARCLRDGEAPSDWPLAIGE